MIEDELRATFARHEELTPPAEPLREAIDRLTVRRRRRRFVVRAAGTALAVLVTVSVPVLARTIGAGPVPRQAGGAAATPAPTAPVAGAPLNLLLLGVDGGGGRDIGNRADSVLIVHVPRDRSRLYLIALPRDLGVEIPGQGFGKLNSAFYYGSHRTGAKPDMTGGAELTGRTVTSLTGVPIDGTATLTFTGLRKVTDAVGGVDICLDQRVQSSHTERVFPAGCQHVDGATALDLLQQRRGLTEGAHDRDRNAERFVKALLAKVSSEQAFHDPVRLLATIAAVGDGLVLNLGGLSAPELLRTLGGAWRAEPVGVGWSYRSVTVNGASYEQLDPAVSRGLFEAVRGDVLDEWVAANPAHVTR